MKKMLTILLLFISLNTYSQICDFFVGAIGAGIGIIQINIKI